MPVDRKLIYVEPDPGHPELEKTKPFKEPIVTEIVAAGPFYRAEEYHQDYYRKNPLRYEFYRTSCGRDARVKQLWGDH